MKKLLLSTLIVLMTCAAAAGQSMFSGSTDLGVIANEWEGITLKNVHEAGVLKV